MNVKWNSSRLRGTVRNARTSGTGGSRQRDGFQRLFDVYRDEARHDGGGSSRGVRFLGAVKSEASHINHGINTWTEQKPKPPCPNGGEKRHAASLPSLPSCTCIFVAGGTGNGDTGSWLAGEGRRGGWLCAGTQDEEGDGTVNWNGAKINCQERFAHSRPTYPSPLITSHPSLPRPPSPLYNPTESSVAVSGRDR